MDEKTSIAVQICTEQEDEVEALRLLVELLQSADGKPVAAKPAFRDAWKRSQHCIVPMEAFWEPDWRSGKNVWTRIGRPGGEPVGAAGLWSWWRPPGASEEVYSFTLLTINADAHPLMRQYHRSEDEKRMIVVLREEDYDAWLDAPADRSTDFMRQCNPEQLRDFAPAT